MKMAQPFYRKKFRAEKYLEKGEPREITEDTLSTEVPRWWDLKDEEMETWNDAYDSLKTKKKKREFKITMKSEHSESYLFDEKGASEPLEVRNGYFFLSIEILHVEHRGFRYSAQDKDKEKLQRRFWPTVQRLLATFITPSLQGPPPLA